jgi:nitrate/nitrite transport system substrate-binding protein
VAVLLAGAHGIDPFRDVKNIVVPPPQMVANMRVGNMDGYCVRAWNQRAIVDKIGFTAVTTQDIWTDHPKRCSAPPPSLPPSTPTPPGR